MMCMHTHMFEVYCNMLNKLLRYSKFRNAGEDEDIGIDEMYKMLGALSSCLHLFHNIPAR